ncbi:MAG: ATP-binding protein [Candidatus Competibacter sp.]
MSERKTTPGIHPNFLIERFSGEEKSILRRLSHEWFLTSSGCEITLVSSTYNYFLMKPTSAFSEMFNIEREVICVLSPYANFEPRTLDVFAKAHEGLTELRAESICKVLISADSNVEQRIDSLLKSDPEQPIVVPFTYEELFGQYDDYFIRNRFRKHFYSRNLFDFLSPLKSDLYFFGRSQLVHELVNRHKSGEHTGLFGLRKSGKTSIIYAVERTLGASGERFVSLDCESPSIHMCRWNELLEKLVHEYHSKVQSKAKIQTTDRYDAKNAADSFEEDILKIYRSKKAQSTLFIFDEIERISPNTGSSEHWRTQSDFIYFWQTLRGFYQRNPEIFTYMLVGTNPAAVENATLVGHENPIFASIPCQYVPNFSVEQVRQMVRKLGRYVGLKFDELIYSKLADDFGGHPFLIRQACSLIYEECKGERPITVDKALYEKSKKQFVSHSSHYLEMIIEVLREWYPDEYEMLKYLAQGDLESFHSFATESSIFTKHLVGYGLVQQSDNGYVFNIESLKEYLAHQHQYERINLTDSEKIEEVGRRRNSLEKQLRTVVRNALRFAYGNKAKEKVIASLPESRREKMADHSLDSLLSKDASPLFFLDLVNIVNREWEVLKNAFEMEKNKVVLMLEEINRIGRPDAHAKSISKDDFDQLRLYFNKLEAVLSEWA